MLLLLSQYFSPLYPSSALHLPHSPAFSPHLSTGPLVVDICSFPSLFPIQFLTSLHLLYASNYASYSVYLYPLFSLLFPTDNPQCDLHFCGSVPVLVVCIVCFCFCFLGLIVDSYKFVVILLFIVFEIVFLR